ncbi:TPA: DUF3870 domain-containing protein [Staphylococcus pseudintermedius]
MGENNTILVTGFAQLPKGTPLYELHRHIACVLEIDVDTGIIKDASFNFILSTTNQFLSNLVIGYCLHDGIVQLSQMIKAKFISGEQKALIQSISACFDRYEHFLERSN